MEETKFPTTLEEWKKAIYEKLSIHGADAPIDAATNLDQLLRAVPQGWIWTDDHKELIAELQVQAQAEMRALWAKGEVVVSPTLAAVEEQEAKTVEESDRALFENAKQALAEANCADDPRWADAADLTALRQRVGEAYSNVQDAIEAAVDSLLASGHEQFSAFEAIHTKLQQDAGTQRVWRARDALSQITLGGGVQMPSLRTSPEDATNAQQKVFSHGLQVSYRPARNYAHQIDQDAYQAALSRASRVGSIAERLTMAGIPGELAFSTAERYLAEEQKEAEKRWTAAAKAEEDGVQLEALPSPTAARQQIIEANGGPPISTIGRAMGATILGND
jgi:hypothetical protein